MGECASSWIQRHLIPWIHFRTLITDVYSNFHNCHPQRCICCLQLETYPPARLFLPSHSWLIHFSRSSFLSHLLSFSLSFNIRTFTSSFLSFHYFSFSLCHNFVLFLYQLWGKKTYICFLYDKLIFPLNTFCFIFSSIIFFSFCFLLISLFLCFFLSLLFQIYFI